MSGLKPALTLFFLIAAPKPHHGYSLNPGSTKSLASGISANRITPEITSIYQLFCPVLNAPAAILGTFLQGAVWVHRDRGFSEQ